MSGAAPDRHRSVVVIALLFALGGGAAYVLLLAVEQLRTVLIIFSLALLIALTLEPLVAAMGRLSIPRWLAASLSWLLAVAVLAAPVALAARAASTQLPNLINAVPKLLNEAESHLGGLGRRLRTLTGQSSSTTSSISPDKALTYVLHGGQLVFEALADTVLVAVLSLVLSITLPNIVETFYRLVPASRRDGVSKVTDGLLTQISRFMLANVLTSVLAGLATWLWAWGWNVPYPALLGALVAVLDLVPTIGSTIGGIIVSLVALTVGLPTALATAVFYIGFRLAEDYLIQPRAMRYSVQLPGVVTIPAVLIGGAVLGIPGALFAVPAALIARVLIQDVALPAADRH